MLDELALSTVGETPTIPAQPPTVPEPPIVSAQQPAPRVAPLVAAAGGDEHIARFLAAMESIVESVEAIARATIAIETAAEKITRDGIGLHL